MSRKKKIILTVVCSFAALFLIVVLIVVWALFGDSIKTGVQSAFYTRGAKIAASEYIEEKYGEKPIRLSKTDTIVYVTGSFWGTVHFEGIALEADGYEIRVFFDRDTGKLYSIIDNRQYDEIRAAVKDYLFNDENLGSSYDGFVFLSFSEEYEKCLGTSVYFDGDVEKFLKDAAPAVSADITYWGYPEKNGKYKELLNGFLNGLKDTVKISWQGVSLFIQDPAQELPEKEKGYYYNYDADTVWINRKNVIDFEKFPRLMAYGYADNNEKDDNIVFER
ncbi:MAG: hypothetical protein NC253_03850 [Ruminococcus sp.]|nr:hypothetical protein [Ruminococcus sp.]MCM1381973.1 hypothetical protein [Muribaculaceae bacterium]